MKVSVITPTLNAAKTLPACLKSVREQDHNDLEHIIVDGGSSDQTCKLAEAHGAILLQEPGSSIYEALNIGIQHAQGDVIGVLNADDRYFNETVITRVKDTFIHNNQSDVVYGNCNFVNIDNQSLYTLYPPRKLKRFLSKIRVFNVSHPSWFVRKNTFIEMGGYNENYHYIADCDFIIACVNKNKKFTYIDQSLANFTLHSSNASRSFKASQELRAYFTAINGHGRLKWLFRYLALMTMYSRDLRYFLYRLRR
jgi:glycosyltransferase involved in cell wall biosynthesis